MLKDSSATCSHYCTEVFAAFIIIKVVIIKFILELAKGVAGGGHSTSVHVPHCFIFEGEIILKQFTKSLLCFSIIIFK
jgi:hypothetical protein